MKPYDYIAQHGIDYFTANKGKNITVRLLSDNGLTFSGCFCGVEQVGDELPLVDGWLIKLPQFNMHLMYKVPEDGRTIPMKFNLLLVDDMTDIKFE